MIPSHCFNHRILSNFLRFFFPHAPSPPSHTHTPLTNINGAHLTPSTPILLRPPRLIAIFNSSSVGATAAAVVAPAGGTARDVQSLSRELGLPAETVLAVMNSGGRGYNRRTSTDAAEESDSGAGGGRGTSVVYGSSTWFYFMSKEMLSSSASTSASASTSRS